MSSLTESPTKEQNFSTAADWTQRAELEAWSRRKRRERNFRHWAGCRLAIWSEDLEFQNLALDKLAVREEASLQQ